MTDCPPHHQHFQKPVSRARRAVFAFVSTGVCITCIMILATLKFPPTSDIIQTAIHVLGDISTFIGIGYIGGSVVDYSGMFTALGNRFGVSIPWAQANQSAPAGAPAAAAGATPDVEGQ